MQDLKKEGCIITESGMDEDKLYVLIGKMNVLQGKAGVCCSLSKNLDGPNSFLI